MKTSERISVKVLLDAYEKEKQADEPAHLSFKEVGDRDVYNITAPFMINNQAVIAGRVERRDSEHSEIMFFHEKGEAWLPIGDAPVFTLQDPFVAVVQDDWVIGGVEIFPHPEQADALGWRTVFYKGKSLNGLTRFAQGPDGMKDIRLVELMDGHVGIFTRPQGEKGGRGRIGYTEVEKLDDLSIAVIEEAPLLDIPLIEEEWCGVNELHLIENGTIGALGHIACFDQDGDRHYYPISFVFEPNTQEVADLKIIARRANFLGSPAKRPDLVDVIFSGGLIRLSDGTARLYAGVSDAAAQAITIPDPFHHPHKKEPNQ